eukprot:CAMPEP_0202443468 /NCGR_PEP_ID=MMETSP1360-20130828/2716_1 /ASSEMBLY_ACC=CAM_ASM_000848 /TAXON_ID=515479 /ORGANISM="Licmophora paradoxa, Strain CCMP2313" /LENGTH=699 /DNA_ID=CAMNT_0049059157 /DNA_START=24 /DNA_END=2123 /DNA_ORIENTATION=-
MSMWGGGAKPPRPPITTPPPPGPSVSNQRQNDELEALRHKGLAKLLNRHFTTVTKAIAQERAEAEAALKDLEQRKANTSEFVSSGSGLNVFDKKLRELQSKRMEVKRKERETLLLYQRYVDKFGGTGYIAPPASSNWRSSSPSTPVSARKVRSTDSVSPSVSSVGEIANEIESNLSQHVARGAERHPSIKTFGIESTYKDVHQSSQNQSRALALRILEGRGIDVKSSPGSRNRSKKLRPDANTIPSAPVAVRTDSSAKGSSSKSNPTKTSLRYESPIRDSNSQFTFPTEADSLLDDPSDDNRSTVSGLTSTSCVMSDAESQLVEFLRVETEAIRHMVDKEDNVSVASSGYGRSRVSISSIADDSTRAAAKAEDMVRQMETMIKSFDMRNKDLDNTGANREPHELKTLNPDEKWMVCWDSNHKREYYHEAKSGTVQWERPDTATMSTTVDSYRNRGDVLSHYDVLPESGLRRMSSRRELYRLKQKKKKKKRRLAGVAVASILLSTTAYGLYKYQCDDVFSDRVDTTLDLVHSAMPESVASFLGPTRKQRELIAAEENAKKEALRKKQEAKRKEEAARKAKEEAARKAREKEAELEAQKIAAQKEADERARAEAERRKQEEINATEKRIEEEARLRQKMESQLTASRMRMEKELAQMRDTGVVRPWHCHIPLFYLLNKRCRELLNEVPIFDLKALTDAMMQ